MITAQDRAVHEPDPAGYLLDGIHLPRTSGFRYFYGETCIPPASVWVRVCPRIAGRCRYGYWRAEFAVRASGYAEAAGLPNEMGLIKNQYVARTFIQPTQELREQGVRMKPSAVRGG